MADGTRGSALRRICGISLVIALSGPVLAAAPPICSCVSNQLGVEVNYALRWSHVDEEGPRTLGPNQMAAYCWVPRVASSLDDPTLMIILVPDVANAAARVAYKIDMATSTDTHCKDVPRSSWYNIAYQAGSNRQRIELQWLGAATIQPQPPTAPPRPPPPTVEPRLMGSGGRP